MYSSGGRILVEWQGSVKGSHFSLFAGTLLPARPRRSTVSTSSSAPWLVAYLFLPGGTRPGRTQHENTARVRVVVTPEQVEIRLRPAGLGRRGLALLVDSLCAMTLASAIALVVARVVPDSVAGAVNITLGFAVVSGWHVLFELRQAGRTPGKQVLGLRVVDAAGLPLTPAQSVVRNVARALDGLPLFYGVGAAAAALDPWRRRIGDRLADTLVIREARTGKGRRRRRAAGLQQPRRPAHPPPPAQAAAPGERDFVLALARRASRLDPAARYDLMEEVAARLRAQLEIDDPRLSAEGVVKGVAALVRTRAR